MSCSGEEGSWRRRELEGRGGQGHYFNAVFFLNNAVSHVSKISKYAENMRQIFGNMRYILKYMREYAGILEMNKTVSCHREGNFQKITNIFNLFKQFTAVFFTFVNNYQ